MIRMRALVSRIPLLLLLFSAAESANGAGFAASYGGQQGFDTGLTSTAFDSSGNSYIAGKFTGATLVLGGITLTRTNGSTNDVFIAKRSAAGVILWAKNFGGSGVFFPRTVSVAVDSSANVYVTTSFQNGNLTTPALTKIGNIDAFVAKLDSNGNTTWAKNFGGAGGAYVDIFGLAADSSGNVYFCGRFYAANLTTPPLTRIGDQDAIVFKLDTSGNIVWLKNFGGSGASAEAQSVAVDGSGNVYVSGQFYAANLTTPALTKIGVYDAFTFKLDSNGNTTWAKNFGGSGAVVYGNSVAVDASGNVYVAGEFQSASLTTPAVTMIGLKDAFALKLNSSGVTTWAKNFGGAGAIAYGLSLLVDGSSNVYLAGYFQTADLTSPALTKIGTFDGFAFKLDSSGNTTWAKNFGGVGAGAFFNAIATDGSGKVSAVGAFQTGDLSTPVISRIGNSDGFLLTLDSGGNTTESTNFGSLLPGGNTFTFGITRDAAGNSYLTGYFTNLKLSFGSTTLTRIGTQDTFVAKLDQSGAVLWAKNFGGASTTAYSLGVAVDSSGNAYITGYFQSGNLATPALTKIGTRDAFAVKLDSSGNTVWAKNFGGSGASTYGRSIAVDASGNVYVGGYFSSANLTTPVVTKIGNSDTFAIKLDSSGATTWAKNFGGAGATAIGQAITFDGAGNVYVGGYFGGANLTTPAVTKIGSSDGFAFKLDSNGNTTWAKNFGGSGASVEPQSVAVDGSGNMFVAGQFYSASLTTPALAKIGTQDAFALKLDLNGDTLWMKNFGGAGATAHGQSITVDGTGNSYVGGYFFSADLTTPALTKIGTHDAFAVKLDSTGTTAWSKNFGGSGTTAQGRGVTADGRGNVYLAGYFTTANLTTPSLTKIGNTDAFIINTQLFNTACTVAGKVKFDSTNNVMVFCDGSLWQSMNNTSAVTCTGTTTGKIKYFPSGASSDFVYYGGDSCRSSKGSVTYGACPVNGKWTWDSANSTIKGCVNGTWTSLKGY